MIRIMKMLKLRTELERMLRECPETFNYKYAFPTDGCGCVIPVHQRLFGQTTSMKENLGINWAEDDYLIGMSSPDFDPDCNDFLHMTKEEAKGVVGLTEAIRRVNMVILNYDEDEEKNDSNQDRVPGTDEQ